MDIAEATAGDDQRRIGDQIDRDDRFDLRRRGTKIHGDGRDRDVDDEGVDAEHELRGDDDRQHPPTAGRIDGLRDGLMHFARPRYDGRPIIPDRARCRDYL
ncbi:hypothetical protein ACVW16_003871 [Bradyrhizobium sp. USDA 4474]